jgi:hypothetical protein
VRVKEYYLLSLLLNLNKKPEVKLLLFKATDSSMVEGDCQIQMGRFVSFLQVTPFCLFVCFF